VVYFLFETNFVDFLHSFSPPNQDRRPVIMLFAAKWLTEKHQLYLKSIARLPFTKYCIWNIE